ncbi:MULTISPECIES: diaminopimelate epimerase [unclassified Streptomyces]|uniref:diaminopimelate epimerase n=1 Tax=unclassified Streptomyces TaxID=2593676 RepID=UPI001660F42F|nr:MULTISPECIES: diaminopimelate epimerase [unclassified Streptomyces]MBD0707715.1 diaminopimelate epimerase [Streptomyces sp. CBMA291]MBD0714950.1 diaminopimelate epimerase [Streptomyces sp. CBMA370]
MTNAQIPPLPFLKGHGTENDFVIVPDAENAVDLPPAVVARLCDRRAGIGGDGLLHVVRSAAHPEARHLADEAEWFMDYRNADGSVAEMCGNGVRVFARYLEHAGHVTTGEVAVATRGGVKRVRLAEDGSVTVAMGRAVLPDAGVTVSVDGRGWPARNVNMGNPHAVAFVEDLAHAGTLHTEPHYEPAGVYPEGVNIEFVVDRGPRHVAMRVHERGAAETRSCGTGACAVAVATARRDGADPAETGNPVTYTVDVLGGTLVITEHPDGRIDMTGPAVIVAEGTVDPEWLG